MHCVDSPWKQLLRETISKALRKDTSQILLQSQQQKGPEVHRCNFWWEKSVLLFNPFYRIKGHYFKNLNLHLILSSSKRTVSSRAESDARSLPETCRKRGETFISVLGWRRGSIPWLQFLSDPFVKSCSLRALLLDNSKLI